MSWATDGLTEDELWRYRGVQRLRHGIWAEVFNMRGKLVGEHRDIPASHVRFQCLSSERQIRVVFHIEQHSWAVVATATKFYSGDDSHHDSWIFTVDLP